MRTKEEIRQSFYSKFTYDRVLNRQMCLSRIFANQTELDEVFDYLYNSLETNAKEIAIAFLQWNMQKVGQYMKDAKMYSELSQEKQDEITRFEVSGCKNRFEIFLEENHITH